MKPINEFTEQDGILIETEQESQEIREMFEGMGILTIMRRSFKEIITSYMPLVVYPSSGTYSSLEYAKKEQKTLHPASDYLIKAGDEVEVRDFEDKTWFTNEYFVGKTLKGRLVCEDEEGQISSWDLIRKSPKAKAIAEIKKIAEENGITVEIK
jgi:hypothetical protein